MKPDVLLVYFHGILVPEWWLADKEFVDEDAKGPPVYCTAVARVLDGFWCEVFLDVVRTSRKGVARCIILECRITYTFDLYSGQSCGKFVLHATTYGY